MGLMFGNPSAVLPAYIAAVGIYCAQAYLPFMQLTTSRHYVFGAALSMIGGTAWVWVSRHVGVHQLSVAALVWDSIITFSFLFIPMLASKQDLSSTQVVGIGTVLVGLLLCKMG